MVQPAADASHRQVMWGLAAVMLAAAGLRFWGIAFGLPFGYARPDETYVIDVVMPLLRGERPPPNFDYPWLYMWLSGAAYVGYYVVGAATGTFQAFADMPASWKTDHAPFFLINRALSATAGTLTVLLVFHIARHLWNRRTALVAAAFLALAYLHVRDSHYGTTDATMTFFAVWSVLLLLRARADGGWHRFAGAGLAGGLAAATKYNAVLIVVPFLMSTGLSLLHAAPGRWREAGRRALAYGVPFGLAVAVGMPFVAFDPAGSLHTLRELLTSTSSGQPHLELGPGWLTHLQYSLRYGVGVGMLAAGLAGMGVMAVRDGARGWLVLAFPLAYFAVMGGLANQYFRYMVPVVPFLALAAAGTVDGVAGWVAARVAPAFRSRVLTAVGATLALAMAVEPGLRAWRFDRALAATDNRVVAATWIAEHVPPGSAILVTGSHYGHPWMAQDRDYRPWVWDSRNRLYWLPDDATADRPEWILRQEHPLSDDRAEVRQWLQEGYVVAWRFPAMTGGRRPRVFDRMDAFYLPFSGFDGVVRPGPSFTLFRRAALAPGLEADAR